MKTAPQSSFRILVADDNPVNQKVMVHMLKKGGGCADVAANGREAVEALEGRRYDLVLMDCQMPEMDGFAATAAIRAAEHAGDARVAIIGLTANAMQRNRDACLAAGMDDYLSKPIKIDELSTTIDRYLGVLVGP